MVGVGVVAALIGIAVLVTRSPVPQDLIGKVTGSSAPAAPNQSPVPGSVATANVATRCRWLQSAIDRHESDLQLARLVVNRMTLGEKLGEIVLVADDGYENIDAGVPRLCIPALTLQDGPAGVAYGATGVTQLPAPLGIAATFDPSVARTYGEVQGSEATGQGIDVVQGPNLNIERVPQSGRAYEGFGEDPLVVSAMGVADIEGIQSTGAMAMAKHFAVYSQETDRGALDDVVSERALQEIYLPPFEAAVTQAHVASIMCAYPKLNGTYQCQDPQLQSMLAQWGFTGFVRSDLGSVHDPIAALSSGTDLIKPARVRALSTLIDEHQLPVSVVDAAVIKVVTQIFAAGLVGQAQTGSLDSPVDSDAHTAFDLQAAERSAVLLKNASSILPLDHSPTRSVAVIGADASTEPVTAGFGSSRVIAPFVSTPLDAIRHRMGAGADVSYTDGGSTTGNLPPVPTRLVSPASGGGQGLTLTLDRRDPRTGVTETGESVQTVVPTADLAMHPHPTSAQRLPGALALLPVGRSPRSLSFARGVQPFGPSTTPTRSDIVLPPGWSDVVATMTGTLTPHRTGLYVVSLEGSGAASLTLDGSPAVSDTLVHGNGRWSETVSLTAGHAYRVDLTWDPIDTTTPSGETNVVSSTFSLGWQFVSDQIAAAAQAAARADTAVVFAADFNAEAFDRPSLSLPGDENALIDAVSAANPRTVVVLNTGGPVLMPWLHQVAAVMEAWYPGEQDGAATAALLFGDVDPSGRLPVTFPQSQRASAISSVDQWPGVDLTATYSEGLEVGYRYNQATGVKPLFPFGFGLAYTHFALARLQARSSSAGVNLTASVTNEGDRAGTAVPQAYLTQPPSAGEPPDQLAAFATVALAPGQTRTVTLTVPSSAFRAYLGNSWTTVPGTYTLSVGQSSSDLPLSVAVAAP